MGFLTKKSSPRASIVYDVSDDSVAVAFVSTDKKLPEILWSRRYPVIVKSDHSNDFYTRGLRQAFNVLQQDVVKVGFPLLKRAGIKTDGLAVKCVLSSGYHIADTITSRLYTGKAFIPSAHHVEKAQLQAHDDFLTLYKDAFYEDDPIHVSQRMLGIYGDGQPISLARKRPVEKLNVNIYISKMPRSVFDILKSQLGQTFNEKNITFYSGYEIINDALMGTNKKMRDFFVILPSKRKTDVLYTSGGSIRGVSSSSIGEDFMVRTIAKSLDRPASDVRSRVQLYRQGRHHPYPAREMDIGLREIGRRWSDAVHKSMQTASSGELPKQAYLLLPASKTSAVFDEFVSCINEKTRDLEVLLINQKRLSDYVQNYNTTDYPLTVSVLGCCGY